MITDLKITYNGGRVNIELDLAIGSLLEKYGLRRWASSFDFETQIRELAFDGEGHEQKDHSRI